MAETTLYILTLGILSLVFTFLIVLNGAMAIPNIKAKQEVEEVQSNVAVDAVSGSEDLPNVYLCIFDEYGGYDCLREYCDYDNEPFYTELKERGFNVSYDSYGNSIRTEVEVSNLLNLDMVSLADDSYEACLSRIEEPVLYQVMRKADYEINYAGGGFLDPVGCEYVYNGEYESKEFSAEYYIMLNSAYYPFYKYVSDDEVGELQSHLNYVANSYTLSDKNLFTVSYVCCPHIPWFVDENGQGIDASLRENWLERSTYLGQLKYLNKLLLSMVDEILQNDPDSIIMLFSDHGFRCVTEGVEKYGVLDPKEDQKYQMNILNAVYYRGEPLENEGLSNYNTVRLLLNELLGTEYEMVG